MKLAEGWTRTLERPLEREAREKQIRLAVVCYGGVSLAIYMHGVTKEIHKLLIASRAYERDQSAHGFAPGSTEALYWELLRDLEQRDGLRRLVVVDVISGSSAGGINGVFLAKAIARNRPQDALRDLWMEKGSITRLLGLPGVPTPLKLAWWVLTGVAPRAVGIAAERVGLRAIGARLISRPPLKGDLIVRWLNEALDGMERASPVLDGVASLLPDGHALELHVTATDFHGQDQEIWIDEPAHVFDRKHRQVLSFRHDDASSSFGAADHPPLTFAAAATSAFPGAFPPVSIGSVARALRGAWDPRPFVERAFRAYRLAGVPADRTFFVDGGVLDNFPFRHAIDAVIRKPAATQVKRRLVYIEPHPASRTIRERPQPGWLRTAAGAVLGLPRHEPILDDLMAVRDFNERVRGLHDLVAHSARAIDDALPVALRDRIGSIPEASELEAWHERIHREIAAIAGPGYPAYLQLKQVSAVRQLASVVERVRVFPERTNHAFFVREVFDDWADRESILPVRGALEKDQIDFLRSFDLAFSERRLRFVIGWVNDRYATLTPGTRPDRGDLNLAKRALYLEIARLGALGAGTEIAEPTRALLDTLFDEAAIASFAIGEQRAGAFVDANRTALNEVRERLGAELTARLHHFTWNLYQTLDRITDGWAEADRSALLQRYLAFPLWDVVTFPVIALGDAGEMWRIGVARFSPEEAGALGVVHAADKLKGIKLAHFGAFFRRRWRENDYTWGRLDGAEHLIGLLLGDVRGVRDEAARAEVGALARRAARAIFTEESGLRGARALQRRFASLLNQEEG